MIDRICDLSNAPIWLPYVRHTKHVAVGRAQKPELSDGQAVVEYNVCIPSQCPFDHRIDSHVGNLHVCSRCKWRSYIWRGRPEVNGGEREAHFQLLRAASGDLLAVNTSSTY